MVKGSIRRKWGMWSASHRFTMCLLALLSLNANAGAAEVKQDIDNCLPVGDRPSGEDDTSG